MSRPRSFSDGSARTRSTSPSSTRPTSGPGSMPSSARSSAPSMARPERSSATSAASCSAIRGVRRDRRPPPAGRSRRYPPRGRRTGRGGGGPTLTMNRRTAASLHAPSYEHVLADEVANPFDRIARHVPATKEVGEVGPDAIVAVEMATAAVAGLPRSWRRTVNRTRSDRPPWPHRPSDGVIPGSRRGPCSGHTRLEGERWGDDREARFRPEQARPKGDQRQSSTSAATRSTGAGPAARPSIAASVALDVEARTAAGARPGASAAHPRRTARPGRRRHEGAVGRCRPDRRRDRRGTGQRQAAHPRRARCR